MIKKIEVWKMFSLFETCFFFQGLHVRTFSLDVAKGLTLLEPADISEFQDHQALPMNNVILLMEEIPNNHLVCIKPCK